MGIEHKDIKYWVGIDPGAKGCLAMLDSNNNIYFYDFPKKEENLALYLCTMYKNLSEGSIRLVAIEKVHSMPQQSAQSGFTFGINFGIWKTILCLTKISHIYVTPQKWFKAFNIHKSDGKTTKDQVRTQIQRLFPNAELYGKKGGYLDGRGDALLLAYYAKLEDKGE